MNKLLFRDFNVYSNCGFSWILGNLMAVNIDILSGSDFVPTETNESDANIRCSFFEFETPMARPPAVVILIQLGGCSCH
jgi:hypothetical protein